MGNSASNPLPPSVSIPTQSLPKANHKSAETSNDPLDSTTKAVCPVSHESSESGTCPISFFSKKKKSSRPSLTSSDVVQRESSAVPSTESACPVAHRSRVSGAAVEGCPVSHRSGAGQDTTGYIYPTVYNVYSQEIDKNNQMPVSANQSPAEGQLVELSTSRAASSIPKGGTDKETWTYPSSQMFWNALSRKNKTQGVEEKDVDTIIAIHNNMNEKTWNQVLEWEKLHAAEVASAGSEPKLLKFIGRPDDLSPLARIRVLLGHKAPFDRHDWTVDRGGKLVRYVIDYYHDESGVNEDATPKYMNDPSAMKSIVVEVRPALDSVEAVIDRAVLMPLAQYNGTTQYRAPNMFASPAMKTAEQLKLMKVNDQWKNIEKQCASCKNTLMSAADARAQGSASIALQVCVARVVCPNEAANFQECTAAIDTTNTIQPDSAQLDRVALAYSSMVKCLELFEAESKDIMQGK